MRKLRKRRQLRHPQHRHLHRRTPKTLPLNLRAPPQTTNKRASLIVSGLTNQRPPQNPFPNQSTHPLLFPSQYHTHHHPIHHLAPNNRRPTRTPLTLNWEHNPLESCGPPESSQTKMMMPTSPTLFQTTLTTTLT